MKFDWKIFHYGIILWNLTIFAPVVSGQDAVSELREELLESQVALEGFRSRNRELEAQLAERDAEVAGLRSRYAELLVATDAASDEATRLELAAAHLVAQAENPAASDAGVAVELLDALGLAQRRLLELEKALRDHEKSMKAVLDACQPSQALRQIVEESLAGVSARLDDCLKPVTLATAPQNGAGQLSAAILKADRQTQVVVLDQGFLNGVRTGMLFAAKREGAVAVRLKVIEVRPLCSALILEQGDFGSLVPGMLLQREPALLEGSPEPVK